MGLWGYGVMGVMWVMGLYGVIRGYGVVFFRHTSRMDNNFDGTFPKRVCDARDLLGKVS